jgi:hypothetical protein
VLFVCPVTPGLTAAHDAQFGLRTSLVWGSLTLLLAVATSIAASGSTITRAIKPGQGALTSVVNDVESAVDGVLADFATLVGQSAERPLACDPGLRVERPIGVGTFGAHFRAHPVTSAPPRRPKSACFRGFRPLTKPGFAEGVGFEPTGRFRPPVFKTGSIGRSDSPPGQRC